jgi:hypothetical protein
VHNRSRSLQIDDPAAHVQQINPALHSSADRGSISGTASSMCFETSASPQAPNSAGSSSSRNSDLRESTEADIEIILQGAKECHLKAWPRIISDNGPQFTEPYRRESKLRMCVPL